MTTRSQVYELRVRGVLPADLLAEIGAMDVVEEPPFTVLRTEPIDHSALHGVMQRLLSLGLDLLEVRMEAWGNDTEPTTGSLP